jgi:hypothetical protein
MRQHAPDLESAEVAPALLDDEFDQGICSRTTLTLSASA